MKCEADSITRYVLSKRGSDGGYLSYQYMDMFESSAEDTYYALATLKALGAEPPDPGATVEFLRSRQVDGGFRSLPVAYFTVKALHLLGEEPRDPEAAADYIAHAALEAMRAGPLEVAVAAEEHFMEDGSLKSFDAGAAIAGSEVPSSLVAASRGVEALSILGGVPGEVAREALETVRRSAQPGGGYGWPVATVDATYHAVKVLSVLGASPAGETLEWLLRCEDGEGGFNVRPGVKALFLENLYHGLAALKILGGGPRHPRAHVELICRCQNGDGGFRRSPVLGLSTLESTYYAVKSLELLGEL